MKIHACLVLLIIFIASCNSKKTESTVAPADTPAIAAKTDSGNVKTDSHYFWMADMDGPKGLIMVKTRPVSKDSLTATNMIAILNSQHPQIQLSLTKVSNDSIFIKIKNSTHLTQRIGSSGAEAYLAEVTYNLTELGGIDFVDIQFTEGDHASPGTYSRTDFVEVKE